MRLLIHLIAHVVLITLVCGVLAAAAGERQFPLIAAVPQATARAHRSEAELPRYPKIAQAARVEGLMLVDTVIGVDGRVISADLLFSIPMLDAATLDAVRAWQFDPFARDGRALAARTVFALRFQEFGQVIESDQFDSLADAMLLCLANLEQARFENATAQCDAARREATMSVPARTRASRLLNDARFGHENFSAADRLHTAARASADAGRHDDALRPYEEAERRLRQIHGRMPAGSPARAGVANALSVLVSDYAVSLEATGRTRDAERIRSRLRSLPR